MLSASLYTFLLFIFYIKITCAKNVIVKFDEYIRKIEPSKVFEKDDIVNIFMHDKPNLQIQDLTLFPQFYESFAIHSGIEYNSKYYFESGSFEYHIYDQSNDKQCIKRCVKEGIHYGAIAIINYRQQLLGDSVLCKGTFLHAI